MSVNARSSSSCSRLSRSELVELRLRLARARRCACSAPCRARRARRQPRRRAATDGELGGAQLGGGALVARAERRQRSARRTAIAARRRSSSVDARTRSPRRGATRSRSSASCGSRSSCAPSRAARARAAETLDDRGALLRGASRRSSPAIVDSSRAGLRAVAPCCAMSRDELRELLHGGLHLRQPPLELSDCLERAATLLVERLRPPPASPPAARARAVVVPVDGDRSRSDRRELEHGAKVRRRADARRSDRCRSRRARRSARAAP